MADRVSSPEDVTSEIEKGKKHLSNGDYSEAYSTFRGLTQNLEQLSKENQICVHCGVGEAFWGLGERFAAKESYQHALKLDSTCARALSGLGGVLGDCNEIGQSLYHYDLALASATCDATVRAETLNNKAFEYIKFGRFDEALEYFNKAIDAKGGYIPAHINKSYLLYRKGLYKDAIDECDKAMSLIHKEGYTDDTPKVREYYKFLKRNEGLVLAASGKYPEAVKCFDKAIELFPSDIGLYSYKGSALANDNKYEEAQTCFNQALSFDPWNAGALVGLDAVKQLEKKDRDYREEIKKFRKTLLEEQQKVQSLAQEYLGKILSDFTFGLNSAQWMFIIQFVVGTIILLGAVLLNTMGDNDLLSYILGATGGLTIVTSAIFTSPLRIQDNRVDFAQWMMAYFDWVYTFYAAQMLFAQKADDKKISEWSDVKAIHDDLHAITREALDQIETYCSSERKRGIREYPNFLRRTSPPSNGVTGSEIDKAESIRGERKTMKESNSLDTQIIQK